MKIGMVSLGCAKNLVDSEYILGLLRQDKTIKVIDDIEASDAIFINTCGFINDAKKEAIDTIFSVVSNKPKDAYLIVVGCLAQRYKSDIHIILINRCIHLPFVRFLLYLYIYNQKHYHVRRHYIY